MTTVTGTINGHDISTYTRGLQRVTQLCNPLGLATVTLSTDYPHNPSPSQAVVIFENGVKSFTGYVIKVTRERPSYDWRIECHDTYTRCANYFIDQKITVGYDDNDQPITGYQPQSSDFWIAYLCNLAGISYSIDSGSGGTIPPGVQIGLRSVHESLTDILAYSSQISRVDENGTLHFFRVVRGSPDVNITNVISIEDARSDEETRNRIKVFGFASYKNRIFSSQGVSIPGITPERITAIASPMIQTQSEADRVSSYLLSELGQLTRIITARIDHDPTLYVGQVARINARGTNHLDAITALTTRIDERESTTEITIGERCPRISGWSQIFPFVYAGTSGAGVYRSMDSGASWGAFNTGLPTLPLYVKKLSFNFDGEGMGIINGRLYHTDGNSWTSVTVPTPVNTAGDSPAPGYGSLVSVGALGIDGSFGLLTTNPRTSGSNGQECRAWYYSTNDAGSTWTSTELQTTGSGWHAIGIDLSSENGAPSILLSSGSIYAGYPAGIFAIKDSTDRIAPQSEGGFAGDEGVIDYQIGNIYMTGVTPNRVLHVQVHVHMDTPDGNGHYNFHVFGMDKEGWGLNDRNDLFRRAEKSDHIGSDVGQFNLYTRSPLANTNKDVTTEIVFQESQYAAFWQMRFSFYNDNGTVTLHGDVITGEPYTGCSLDLDSQRATLSWLAAGYIWGEFT